MVCGGGIRWRTRHVDQIQRRGGPRRAWRPRSCTGSSAIGAPLRWPTTWLPSAAFGTTFLARLRRRHALCAPGLPGIRGGPPFRHDASLGRTRRRSRPRMAIPSDQLAAVRPWRAAVCRCGSPGSCRPRGTTRRQAIVLGAFAAAFYGLIGSGQTVFFRYVLPLVPILVPARRRLPPSARRAGSRRARGHTSGGRRGPGSGAGGDGTREQRLVRRDSVENGFPGAGGTLAGAAPPT